MEDKNLEIFERKMFYFFHDPINKPIILMQTEQRHEEIAKNFSQYLNIKFYNEDNTPDHIASALERLTIPKNYKKEIRFLNNPEVIHTLSGIKLERIKELKSEDNDKKLVEESNKIVESVFKEIQEKTKKYNAKQKYFYIWRNLLPLLREKSENSLLKKYWEVIPADTRVPDHSIFQHLKTSAMCSFSSEIDNRINNKLSLFLFSITPVQSFIQDSRKLSDLKWGSYILSYLCWKAIEIVIDNYGPDTVIFPDLLEQPLVDYWLENTLKIEVKESKKKEVLSPSIPNRFFAMIPENDKKTLLDLGIKIENAIKEEIKNFILTIEKNLNVSLNENQKKHLIDYFNFYWVFLPIESSSGTKFHEKDFYLTIEKYKEFINEKTLKETLKELESIFNDGNKYYSPNIGNIYGVLYKTIETINGSLKNVKNFNSFEEEGNKCDICGERVIVFHNNKKHSSKESIDLSKNKTMDLYLKKLLKENEGLCITCFFKRVADIYFKERFNKDLENQQIPSVSYVALVKFLEKIKNDESFKKLKDLLGSDYDPQIFYDENRKEYFKEIGIDDNKFNNAETLIKQIVDKKTKLPKYYAVIVMDGDFMGKWLSGENSPDLTNFFHSLLKEDFKGIFKDKKRPLTPAIHNEISNALKNFSLLLVKKIVEKYKGTLVYSGGDDVLALVNLDDVLDMIYDIRKVFSGNETEYYKSLGGGFVEIEDRILKLMGPKASISGGVCIAYYKEPLNIVLKEAREMEKEAKKGVKNSFAIKVIKHSGQKELCKFNWDKENINSIELIKRLIDYIKNDKLSSSFIYELRDIFNKIKMNKEDEIFKEMVKSELNRIIPRKIKNKKEERFQQEVIDTIYSLYEISSSFDNFINSLKIVRFFATKEE